MIFFPIGFCLLSANEQIFFNFPISQKVMAECLCCIFFSLFNSSESFSFPFFFFVRNENRNGGKCVQSIFPICIYSNALIASIAIDREKNDGGVGVGDGVREMVNWSIAISRENSEQNISWKFKIANDASNHFDEDLMYLIEKPWTCVSEWVCARVMLLLLHFTKFVVFFSCIRLNH